MCGARTAAPAGGGDPARSRSPDDTPVLGPLGFYEPFDRLFREMGAIRPLDGGASGDRQDPYDRLYAPDHDERPGWTARLPPAATEAPRDSGPPRQYGAAGWEPGPLGHDVEGLDVATLHTYGWMRRPNPAIGSRKRIIFAVLAVIAFVAGSGGALGYGMYRYHPPPVRIPSAEHSAGESGPGAAPRVSSPAAELSNSTVAAAPSVAGVPAARSVVGLLTHFFRAINAHDYPAYRQLLDPKMKAEITPAVFGTGYRSTVDSRATLTGISATADGRAAAKVLFTSHQAPSDSPDGTACTSWKVTLFLDRADGRYLIAEPPPGYQPSYQPC